MNTQINYDEVVHPILVSLTYNEAANIVYALEHIIPKDQNYPNTNRLLDLLQATIKNPYFD